MPFLLGVTPGASAETRKASVFGTLVGGAIWVAMLWFCWWMAR